MLLVKDFHQRLFQMINSFFADSQVHFLLYFNGQQESKLLLISSRRQNVHLTFFSTSFWMRRNSKTETIPEEIGEMNQEATENKQMQRNLAHELKKQFFNYLLSIFFFLLCKPSRRRVFSVCLPLSHPTSSYSSLMHT